MIAVFPRILQGPAHVLYRGLGYNSHNYTEEKKFPTRVVVAAANTSMSFLPQCRTLTSPSPRTNLQRHIHPSCTCPSEFKNHPTNQLINSTFPWISVQVHTYTRIHLNHPPSYIVYFSRRNLIPGPTYLLADSAAAATPYG